MNHSHRHRGYRRRSARPAITGAAIVGIVLTAGAVGAQAIVGASSDDAVATPSSSASVGEPPTSADAGGSDVSRDAERPPLNELDLSAVDEAASAAAEQVKESAEKAKKAAAKAQVIADAQADPRGTAQSMLADFGWGAAQFSCLNSLWVGESDWDYTATNPSSGAYGIPQSLPANKMATAGDDWKTNPITQIRWGLAYIKSSYGTPCSAQAFKSGAGWY